MITDSHCHLASESLFEERESIIARALDSGVTRIITLSTCLEDVAKNLELAQHPHVFTALGIHPCDVHHAPDDALETFAKQVNQVNVVAIGETGLDYFHPAPEGWNENDFRKRQQNFLVQHFELAQASGLNIVIHTRDRQGKASFEDALQIYKKFSHQVQAVFHCFISEWELAERVIELGGFVSFGGVTTFKNAHLVKDVVKHCPPRSFMIETDAPYLAPEPLRGKRNEPAYAMLVAQAIADLRGETLPELAAHTETVADLFFRKKKI